MFGEVEDAVNAVRWLAEQPYVDPNYIYLFGHSVGGGIAALVSLMDDVPIRHCGSCSGLYPVSIFQEWRSIAPFRVQDKQECQLRLLHDNTEWMQRHHYAFAGTLEPDFLAVCRPYKTGKIKALMLHIEEVPGDHFSALPIAVKRYFDIVEKNRKK